PVADRNLATEVAATTLAQPTYQRFLWLGARYFFKCWAAHTAAARRSGFVNFYSHYLPPETGARFLGGGNEAHTCIRIIVPAQSNSYLSNTFKQINARAGSQSHDGLFPASLTRCHASPTTRSLGRHICYANLFHGNLGPCQLHSLLYLHL